MRLLPSMPEAEATRRPIESRRKLAATGSAVRSGRNQCAAVSWKFLLLRSDFARDIRLRGGPPPRLRRFVETDFASARNLSRWQERPGRRPGLDEAASVASV